MKRQRGFTLVELLVVIAIVAILISLLLPALNKARWESVIVKCSAQMKQIGQAAVNYATDNGDFFPPYRGFRGYAIRINTYPAAWNQPNAGQNQSSGGAYTDPTYGIVMQNVSPGNLLYGHTGVGPFPQYETCNIGRLYQTGYMTNLAAAFDPSFDSDSVIGGGNPATSNWNNNSQFYSSYIFSPHAAYMPAIDDREGGNSLGGNLWAGTTTPGQPFPGVPILYNPYATTNTLPPGKCMMIDMVNAYSIMAHTYGIKGAAVNVMFGDCHVQRVDVPPPVIQALMQITGQGSLATIASQNVNKPLGATGGMFPPGASASWSPATGFMWGIAATNSTTSNSPGNCIIAPTSPTTGYTILPQPFLDSYIDLFETMANGGNPTQLGDGSTPTTSDPYWLNSGQGPGKGRVAYVVPG